MPITYGTYTKQLKLLPLVLNSEGTAVITVRYGYVRDGEDFVDVSAGQFNIDSATVSSILDAPPTPGLTRRDDLSLAIYQYLVTQGFVEEGQIS